MSEDKSFSLINLNFLDLLTITFIVLKLTKVIDWSWWWVLSPMIISGAIVIIFLIIALIIYLIVDKD